MEKCVTTEGHIIGMLDRDQRTAKLRYLPPNKPMENPLLSQSTITDYKQQNTTIHHQSVTNINRVVSHSNIPGRTSPHSSCKTRKNRQLWKSLLRLDWILILIIYVNLIELPTISTAPIKMARNDPPIWINPCGAPPPTNIDDGEPIPLAELISQIVNQANIAISQAMKFRSDFAQKSFSMEPDKLQDYWKNVRYEWLPGLKEIPKELGQELADDQFHDLEINETILNVYEYLQKIAVGVEQIVWDEVEQKGEFESEFKEIEGNLKNLLCEIQTAIYELRLKPKDDVKRDIMPASLREMDKTGTNMRNWLIYRDYMNAVEYIIQVFKYFHNQTKA